MDYTDRVQMAAFSTLNTIRREHNKLDGRPPLFEFRRDILDAIEALEKSGVLAEGGRA